MIGCTRTKTVGTTLLGMDCNKKKWIMTVIEVRLGVVILKYQSPGTETIKELFLASPHYIFIQSSRKCWLIGVLTQWYSCRDTNHLHPMTISINVDSFPSSIYVCSPLSQTWSGITKGHETYSHCEQRKSSWSKALKCFGIQESCKVWQTAPCNFILLTLFSCTQYITSI